MSGGLLALWPEQAALTAAAALAAGVLVALVGAAAALKHAARPPSDLGRPYSP